MSDTESEEMDYSREAVFSDSEPTLVEKTEKKTAPAEVHSESAK